MYHELTTHTFSRDPNREVAIAMPKRKQCLLPRPVDALRYVHDGKEGVAVIAGVRAGAVRGEPCGAGALGGGIVGGGVGGCL
jgi:hypothetical protein